MKKGQLVKIPFFNYAGAFQSLEEDFVTIFRDVIKRGAFIQQSDLADFEQHLADYLGVRHAFGVANATDGLTMIWRSVGLAAGDEVIFPSHTMVATAAAIVHAGGVPVAADCGDDHLIDPHSIERALTSRTRAVCPVQLNGRTAEMDAIKEICERHGLLLVEDAAQALGSKFNNQLAGTFGAAAAFSFYPAKLLGCLGDGGAVVTNDDEIAAQIELLRDHGRSAATGEVLTWGYNSRLDNLQAAFLDRQLRDYSEYVDVRRSIARTYCEGLADVPGLRLPPHPDADARHFDVFQNFEIETERRHELQTYLAEHGVGTIRQWGGRAVHQFNSLGVRGDCDRTELLFERCLMLPMNIMVTSAEAEYVVSCIREFHGV